MTRWALTTEGRVALLEFLRKLVRTRSRSGNEGAVAALVM